jgi:hypothetical protein
MVGVSVRNGRLRDGEEAEVEKFKVEREKQPKTHLSKPKVGHLPCFSAELSRRSLVFRSKVPGTRKGNLSEPPAKSTRHVYRGQSLGLYSEIEAEREKAIW